MFQSQGKIYYISLYITILHIKVLQNNQLHKQSAYVHAQTFNLHVAMHFPGLRTALIVAEHKALQYIPQQVITTHIRQ